MREEIFRVFGFIAFGLVLALGVLAVFQLLSISPLWGESGAAWVQALGSIAAIIGAYAIGERQSRAALLVAMQMQDRETERKRNAILAICQAAFTRANLVEDVFCVDIEHDLRRHGEYDPSILRSIIGALEQIALHELQNTITVIGILDMRDQLAFPIQSIQSLDDNWQPVSGELPDVTEARRFERRREVGAHVERIFSAYADIAASMQSTYIA